jgi:hypothetical protein
LAYHGADSKIESGGLVQHGHARHGEIMRLKILSSMTFILWLYAAAAGAQFLQYTPPGGPEQDPETRREELERELEDARFNLGVVRIAPWATLRNVAYVRNFFDVGEQPPDDFTATVGAGLRAYVRNGPRATWTAKVLPEYVWWQKQDERRRLDGRYLLGFQGYFNRLTLEVQAGRQQQQRIVTPEVPVLVSERRDGGEVLVEVGLGSALSLFTAYSVNQLDSLVEDIDDPRVQELDQLNRDERVLRAGLRWQRSERWMVALGAERSEVEFDRVTVDRSNEGVAPVAEVRFEGNRLQARADVAFRSLEAREGSLFVPYDRVTGGAAVFVEASRLVTPSVYFNRGLIYSLFPQYAYLEDERLGAALDFDLGRRTRARVYAEQGTNSYTPFLPLTPRREDDVKAYGGLLEFGLTRWLALQMSATRSSFDSDIPGADRSYTTAGATITLLRLR